MHLESTGCATLCLSGRDRFTILLEVEGLQLTSNDAVFNGDRLTSGGSLSTDEEGLLLDEILVVANGTIIHGTTDGKNCLK